MIRNALLAAFALGFIGATPPGGVEPLPGENHFATIRQLTFGGVNAEGYFSFAEKSLIFQSTRDTFRCDQMFTLDLTTLATRLVSTGTGRTTCGYYLPGDSTILFASTHAAGAACPPQPDFSKGYTWALYPGYDIYTARADGAQPPPAGTRTRIRRGKQIGGMCEFGERLTDDLDCLTCGKKYKKTDSGLEEIKNQE